MDTPVHCDNTEDNHNIKLMLKQALWGCKLLPALFQGMWYFWNVISTNIDLPLNFWSCDLLCSINAFKWSDWRLSGGSVSLVITSVMSMVDDPVVFSWKYYCEVSSMLHVGGRDLRGGGLLFGTCGSAAAFQKFRGLPIFVVWGPVSINEKRVLCSTWSWSCNIIYHSLLGIRPLRGRENQEKKTTEVKNHQYNWF